MLLLVLLLFMGLGLGLPVREDMVLGVRVCDFLKDASMADATHLSEYTLLHSSRNVYFGYAD